MWKPQTWNSDVKHARFRPCTLPPGVSSRISKKGSGRKLTLAQTLVRVTGVEAGSSAIHMRIETSSPSDVVAIGFAVTNTAEC